jgi:hypothetical protein
MDKLTISLEDAMNFLLSWKIKNVINFLIPTITNSICWTTCQLLLDLTNQKTYNWWTAIMIGEKINYKTPNYLPYSTRWNIKIHWKLVSKMVNSFF